MTPWTIRLVLDVALVDEMLFTAWTIQWSRRMRSSQFIPNLVHGSQHTAQLYHWANKCSQGLE